MKLYYAPGACSMAAHITAREAGIDLDMVKVDIEADPHTGADGTELEAVNPKNYVPTLVRDNGSILTEANVVAQYLADLRPESGLAPAPDSPERYRMQEWLTFISSELHKRFTPFFQPKRGEQAKSEAKIRIAQRFAYLDKHLSGSQFLMGETFTVVDAYAFVMTTWASLFEIALTPYPNLKAYADRIARRPKVRDAMEAEGFFKNTG